MDRDSDNPYRSPETCETRNRLSQPQNRGGRRQLPGWLCILAGLGLFNASDVVYVRSLAPDSPGWTKAAFAALGFLGLAMLVLGVYLVIRGALRTPRGK